MEHTEEQVITAWRKYVEGNLPGTQYATHSSLEGFALHILRTTTREHYQDLLRHG